MKRRNIYNCFFTRLFVSVILMLIVLILIKSSSEFKSKFYEKVYSTNFSFSYFNNLYNKYIGNLDFIDNYSTTEVVFNEVLTYKAKEKYLDGVKLTIDTNYLVPINMSGIVVYIGQKEGYGNTVIVQRIDGVDEWYGNISNVNVELYDYVKEGELLGEASNELYLLYKKDGNILDYEEYIK